MRPRTLSLWIPYVLWCVAAVCSTAAASPSDAHQLSGPVAVLWNGTFDGADPIDGSTAIAVSPDGSIVVVTGRHDDDFATLAYDATDGFKMWLVKYGDPGTRAIDTAHDVAFSPDGATVYVTGTAYSAGGRPFEFRDFATVAYNARTGGQIWVDRYTLWYGHDEARAITVSPDGTRVFVTGCSTADYTTIAYDAATGAREWFRFYNGPAMWLDDARDVAVSPDGTRVFVTGSSLDFMTGSDIATIAYDAETGADLWVKRFEAAGTETARAIATSPDGATVLVSGRSNDDYIVVAYDALTGDQRWLSNYGPEGGNEVRAMALSPDGAGVFVTGKSGEDCATLAFDAATGDSLWSRRDVAAVGEAISVSPDSNTVVFTGTAMGGDPSGDYATMAIDAATGAGIWAALYGGQPGQADRPVAVAASPDGRRVFVTGQSGGNFVTVAYLSGFLTGIDIRPESDYNRIDPSSWGHINVALLGREDLDITDTDVATLSFGPGGAGPRHELTDPFIYGQHLRDVNLDGHADLLIHFGIPEAKIACDAVEARLAGALVDGRPFAGRDQIVTEGCKPPGANPPTPQPETVGRGNPWVFADGD